MTKLRNECVALSRRRSLVQVRRRVCPKIYDNGQDEEKGEQKREQAINRRSRGKIKRMSVWQVRCLTVTGKIVLAWQNIYDCYSIQSIYYTEYRARKGIILQWGDLLGDTEFGLVSVLVSALVIHQMEDPGSVLLVQGTNSSRPYSVETLLSCYGPNCLFFLQSMLTSCLTILLRRPNGNHTNSAQLRLRITLNTSD